VKEQDFDFVGQEPLEAAPGRGHAAKLAPGQSGTASIAWSALPRAGMSDPDLAAAVRDVNPTR
jgi:hypothetical protein